MSTPTFVLRFEEPVPFGFAALPDRIMLDEMLANLDKLLIAVGSFEAHYHNFGQSTWLGGDDFKQPTEDIRSLFMHVRAARDNLSSAASAVVLSSIRDGDEPAQVQVPTPAAPCQYTFTVDGQSYTTDEPTIDGAHIRALAGLLADSPLFQVTPRSVTGWGADAYMDVELDTRMSNMVSTPQVYVTRRPVELEERERASWLLVIPGCSRWQRVNLGMRFTRTWEHNGSLAAEVTNFGSPQKWQYRVEPDLGGGEVDSRLEALDACNNILLQHAPKVTHG